jgi:ASC-1-like (ASCH) protein
MTQTTRKPRTHCRGIQEQFVDKILLGEKTTTIRPDAKDMEAGDKIKFFTGWRKKGALYRVTVEIVKAPEEFIIGDYALTDFATTRKLQTMMFVGDGNAMENREEIAKKDGFTSFEDMVDFFRRTYPPKKNLSWSFDGVLITFANPRIEAK